MGIKRAGWRQRERERKNNSFRFFFFCNLYFSSSSSLSISSSHSSASSSSLSVSSLSNSPQYPYKMQWLEKWQVVLCNRRSEALILCYSTKLIFFSWDSLWEFSEVGALDYVMFSSVIFGMTFLKLKWRFMKVVSLLPGNCLLMKCFIGGRFELVEVHLWVFFVEFCRWFLEINSSVSSITSLLNFFSCVCW